MNGQMHDRLLINATLLPVRADAPGATLPRAAVGWTDGRLSFAGPMANLPGTPERLAKTVTDVEGRLVTPGLVDCHTHLVFGGNRAQEFSQRLAGATYEDIARAGGGIMNTVTRTRDASAEDLFRAASPVLARMCAGGVTTVEIKSGYGGDLATEIKMLSVAARLAETFPVQVERTWLAAHVLPPEYGDNRAAYLHRLITEDLPEILRGGHADAIDAFCETIAFSPEELRPLLDAARAAGLKVKLHAEQLSHMGGTTMAADLGAVSADHVEYATQADARAMAAAGTSAVLLPGAFYFLREQQCPPVEMFRAHGVPMAVATDFNPGSSPVSSLLLCANMACTFFGLTVPEAIAGITLHAATALGIAESKGSLEPGKDADLNVWDTDDPSELVYWIGGITPRQTFVGGKETDGMA